MSKDNDNGERRSILDAFAEDQSPEAEDEQAETAEDAETESVEDEDAPTDQTAGERAIPDGDDEADDPAEPKFDASAPLVRPAEPVSDEEGAADVNGEESRAEADKKNALDTLLAQRGTHSVEDEPIEDPRLAERATAVLDPVEAEGGEDEEVEDEEGEEAYEEDLGYDDQQKKKATPGKIALIAIGGIAAVCILVGIGASIGTMAAQEAVQARNIESTQSNAVSGTHEQTSDSNAQKAEDATLAPATDQGTSNTAQTGTTQAVCEHDWQPVATTVHHDAVTKEETVAGSTYVETEYHTLCNVCHEQIDGKTSEHKAATGHNGFTSNVPVKVTKKNPDTTQTVEVEAAYDEKTWTKEKCTKCGAEREVGEHSEKVQ